MDSAHILMLHFSLQAFFNNWWVLTRADIKIMLWRNIILTCPLFQILKITRILFTAIKFTAKNRTLQKLYDIHSKSWVGNAFSIKGLHYPLPVLSAPGPTHHPWMGFPSGRCHQYFPSYGVCLNNQRKAFESLFFILMNR